MNTAWLKHYAWEKLIFTKPVIGGLNYILNTT